VWAGSVVVWLKRAGERVLDRKVWLLSEPADDTAVSRARRKSREKWESERFYRKYISGILSSFYFTLPIPMLE